MFQKTSWNYVSFCDGVEILDSFRQPVNGKDRSKRIAEKSQSELYPYYGATGQVGFIDDFLLDGEYVLLGEDGAPFLNAFDDKAYIISGKTWVNNHAHILKSKTNNKFLCYYLNSIEYKEFVSGTTRLKLTQTDMKRIPVPVPPVSEQERIVARIEEMFSQLDAAVETLQKTKAQLTVYRQAVLKEAFDSAMEDCKMLPISEILTKTGKGMSTGPFGTMIRKSDHKSSGVPMLGIENIGRGRFVDGNKIFVTAEKAEELKSFSLKAGDIIISRSGTVGEICAVPERAEGSLLSTNLMRVSLDNAIIRSDYFIALFQSKGIVLDQIKELCKGSTRDFLNQTILKQIIFPVPSVEKQAEIVSIIETRMSVCDSIEHTIDNALQQAEATRQSILKQAFEGKL